MLRKKSSIMDVGVYRVPKISQKHQNNYKKLIFAMTLSLIFIVAELAGGIISHSIAVISDCLHLVTDLIGFIISFIALKYSIKKSTRLNSFGFHRVQIIGVLANLFIIWSLTLVVIVEACQRIIDKAIVQNPKVMLIVASGGLGVNLLMYFILHSGGHSHLGHSHCKGHTYTDNHEKYLNDQVDIEKQKKDDHPIQQIKQQIEQDNHQDHHHDAQCTGQHSHQHQHPHQHSHQHNNHQKDSLILDDNNLKQPLIVNKQSIQSLENLEYKSQKIAVQNNLPIEKDKKKSKKNNKKNSHIHDHTHDHDHSHSHHDHNHKDHGHGHKHSHSHGDENALKSQHQNMSMKAAILHALTDIIQSIGLLISAILIYFFGSDHGAVVTQYNHWHLLDPISTFVFSILVVVSTFPITKECFHIILQATPSDVDEKNLHQKFRQTKGVHDLHDFHVWSLKPGSMLLSAHVFCSEGEEKRVLQKLTYICRQHKIYHSTIQVQALGKHDYKSPIICQNDIHQ